MRNAAPPTATDTAAPANSPKLLAQVRDKLRVLHDSKRTETSYLLGIEQFLRFARQTHHQWVHPSQLRRGEVNAFLTHLAVERHVAASTPNQALGAILFLSWPRRK